VRNCRRSDELGRSAFEGSAATHQQQRQQPQTTQITATMTPTTRSATANVAPALEIFFSRVSPTDYVSFLSATGRRLDGLHGSFLRICGCVSVRLFRVQFSRALGKTTFSCRGVRSARFLFSRSPRCTSVKRHSPVFDKVVTPWVMKSVAPDDAGAQGVTSTQF